MIRLVYALALFISFSLSWMNALICFSTICSCFISSTCLTKSSTMRCISWHHLSHSLFIVSSRFSSIHYWALTLILYTGRVALLPQAANFNRICLDLSFPYC
ncbi:exported protein of unknown function [Pseudomonas sp. JV551A1]|nr:exported protein of unknown function [Pseudomonas sp. JV551A1]